MLPQTRAIRRMPGDHGRGLPADPLRAGALVPDPQPRNERPAAPRLTGRPMLPSRTEGHDEVMR